MLILAQSIRGLQDVHEVALYKKTLHRFQIFHIKINPRFQFHLLELSEHHNVGVGWKPHLRTNSTVLPSHTGYGQLYYLQVVHFTATITARGVGNFSLVGPSWHFKFWTFWDFAWQIWGPQSAHSTHRLSGKACLGTYLYLLYLCICAVPQSNNLKRQKSTLKCWKHKKFS